MEETKDESKERGVSWKEIVGVIGTLLAAITGYSFQGIRFLYYFTWFFVFLLVLVWDYKENKFSRNLGFLTRSIMILFALSIPYLFLSQSFPFAYTGEPFSLINFILFLGLATFSTYYLYVVIGEIADWNLAKYGSALYYLMALIFLFRFKLEGLAIASLFFSVFLTSLGIAKSALHSSLLNRRHVDETTRIIVEFMMMLSILGLLYYFADITSEQPVFCASNLIQFKNDPNHVLIYGPQELILSFGDGNIQVVKPWQPVVVEKNKLCEANIAITTSLGVTGCRKPSICQSLKKGDNEKPKDSNHK